jgi:dipeptidyl aminopeptidase/acylaminoacyl peptidase
MIPTGRFSVRIRISILLCGVTAGIALCGWSSTATAEPDRHPFSVHDMLAMDRISDPQVSPDGKLVAFTVRETDLEANRGRTDIWLAGVEGQNVHRLTTHPENDWNPRWHTNGELYFLSSRSGSPQVWKIDPAGGEARQVTDLPLPVSNLTIAPQLESIVFSLDVYPNSTIALTVERDAAEADRKTTGLIYDELLFRHWDSWEDGKRSHLFIKRIDVPESAPRDLVPALATDTPTHPWGGAEEFSVSPDGSTIVFTAKDATGSEAAWSTDYDLYAIPTGRPDTPRCLTAENEAWDTEPVFSPDGGTLAYLAMARPGFEADRFRIVLMDLETGQKRVLTEDWDRSPHGLAWSHDSKTLFCTADNLGQRSVFAVEIKSGRATEIVKMGQNGSLQCIPGRLLLSQHSLTSPAELFTVKRNGQDLRQITDLNGQKMACCLIGEPEQFTFPGWNDEEVWAYVVKPYDFDPTRKYPVCFLIHGGPQGSFGNDFHYRWNPQAYVGAGFTTVAIDFHGSVGYGQDFTDSISRHWGDRPYEDLVKGLAAALERYPWMDGERVVAAGASFGGYMINWIAGQPFAKSFRAFVCHDGNLDERMAYFDTEELWFPEWENGGPPWDAPPGAYKEFNPIEYVQNWCVPTLVVHGALDYRVVDTQGLSTFTALRRLGVPARLLYYPDENHWVLKPRNSIQWHEEVMNWLTKWTE